MAAHPPCSGDCLGVRRRLSSTIDLQIDGPATPTPTSRAGTASCRIGRMSFRSSSRNSIVLCCLTCLAP
ncbi:hypothetical protein U9M48_038438 [Paspalum notatum var. saurae]|uniref:Uncharacterized protein n=1 Tax=Paspalum notatum var. saurae TaxID=547442 RepID=A0AAQ3XDJ7_PASNO